MKVKEISFILSGILLFISNFTPYIFIIFTSPQYPDKSPKMFLYTFQLKGDKKDWDVVGRYIGINTNPKLPEIENKIILSILIVLSFILIISHFKTEKWKKTVSIILLIIGLCLAAWAQYRLYQQGHNLDPKAPLRYVVKPFTPPLIGLTKVHRIKIYHFPHLGFFLFSASCLLTLYSSWKKDRRAK